MLDEALYLLKSHKLKVTKQRKSLLEYLYTHCRHRYVEITAVDDWMRQQYPGLSHNTIYRNIKEFEEIGIVETQAQKNGQGVKYQCDFGNIHHHHFICQQCGQVQEIDFCPSKEFLKQLPGCEIQSHRFEMLGLCAQCAAQKRLMNS